MEAEHGLKLFIMQEGSNLVYVQSFLHMSTPCRASSTWRREAFEFLRNSQFDSGSKAPKEVEKAVRRRGSKRRVDIKQVRHIECVEITIVKACMWQFRTLILISRCQPQGKKHKFSISIFSLFFCIFLEIYIHKNYCESQMDESNIFLHPSL